MRRLPNTYPGNTTLYPTGRGTISIGAADADSKVLFYNETPVNLDLDFYNGDTDVLHAWEANFWILDGETADITWAIDIDSLNVVNPPINAVFTTVFSPTERLNDKAYPMPLIRQIGGQQAIVSSASTVVNDGNALLQVIEATLQGHGSSDVIINNDGSFTLKGAGLLAAVGLLTHILGNLTVDGNTTNTGTLTQTGDATFNGAGASITTANDAVVGGSVKTNTIRDNVTGTDLIDLTTNIVTLNQAVQVSSKKINDGSANNLADWSASGLWLKSNPANHGAFNWQSDGVNIDFVLTLLGPAVTGSASATVNHSCKQFGVSTAPTDFLMNPSTGGGSQTFGFNTITSTQVAVVLGATNAYRFRGFK